MPAVTNAAELHLRHLEDAQRHALTRRQPEAARRELASEPRLVVCAPPVVDRAGLTELSTARMLIEASPMRFDGDIWLVRAVNEDEVEVFPATYAWLFCPSIVGHEGPLCICIDVVDVRGHRLIQWANPTLIHHPAPRLAVGGYVDADEHPREAALREAEEELGIAASDLMDFTPRHLLRTGKGVMVVYSATLDPYAQLAPGEEVMRCDWILPGTESQWLPPEQVAYLP